MKSFRLTVTVCACAALGACATRYGPQSLDKGATRAQVEQALGTPTGRYPGQAAERLEYARGPAGRHTYMLDFGADGKLLGWEQVLTEGRFDQLRAGMSRDELLAAVGHPSEVTRLPWQRQELWSYRYETPFCRWFQLALDPAGSVVDTSYGPDPLCTGKPSASP
ncbi:hypothetical protein [Piscinibacter sp. XHJ-5]|uniref:hypothetical protein n=1 Tax=Piscinibacter sp. XHJ-5 TaxID=3037797 RepID=UPI00245304F7|nr:hypothetical protein [Piscinibacter sp. XHJ-5]